MKTLFTILSLLLCNHVFANPIDNIKAEQTVINPLPRSKHDSHKYLSQRVNRVARVCCMFSTETTTTAIS